MKKNYLFLLLSILCFQAKAQILNESANWPNPAWTVTGDYNTDPLAFEADPTATANFAFDDDDAGNAHEDNIAVESPVIDLTAAFNGGQQSLEVTAMYGYRVYTVAVEKLIFQWWDADNGVWVDWGANIPGTGTSVTDDFCMLPKVQGTSGILSISAFTPNQLSNFRYRISYDDNTGGVGFQYGFCFDSPTIQSLVCGAPIGLVANNVSGSSADIEWGAIDGVNGYEYVLDSNDADPAGAGTATTDNFYMASGLDFETQYYFHVRTACSNGLSPWRTVGFTTSPPPPVNDEPAGAIELLLDLGTACGPNKITGISNMDTSGSSAEIDPTCMDQYNPTQGNGDLWFYFTAPTTPVTLNTSDITGNIITVSTALYSGTPGNFTEVGVCGNADVKTYSDLVPGEIYYYRMWDYGNDGIGTWSLCGYYLDCAMPVATYTKISNCPTTEEFFVDVEITDMGTATSLTISDDQGNSLQVFTTGVYNFGPYAMNTPVIYTIANDQSAACTITSPSQTIVACPPANDTCQTAIDLGTLTSPITDTTAVALNDNLSVCGFGGNVVASNAVDVYYFINVPAGSTLTIGQTDNAYDSANVVFYGDCDNPTQIACFDDNDLTTTVWANDTGSDQNVYWVQDGWGVGSGQYTLAWSVVACTNAVAEYNVIADCANGEQFFVEANVTDMGSATSLTISDDQGSAPQTISQAGAVQFGPFPNNTPVIITVTNDQDSDCAVTSPTMNQIACPPSNDDCDNPITLVVGNDITSNPVEGSVAGATNSGTLPAPGCASFNGGDIWYTVQVPADGNITFETSGAQGVDTFDSGIAVYSGTCDSLTLLGCDDDAAATNNFSYLDLTGLNPGEMIYLRLWEYSNDETEAFSVSAYNINLGVSPVDNNGFRAYPNPVKNILNLSNTANISSVSIFNLIGQEVITESIDANAGQVDMSDLAVGTYIVKVTADNQIKTIKVVKQ